MYAFDTFFMKRGEDQLKRLTKKVNIFEFDLIFIPVNQDDDHWVLISIDTTNKTVNCYDSLGKETQAEKV